MTPAFITGAELDVDGGMLCHSPYMTDILQVYGAGQAFGSSGHVELARDGG